MKNRHQKMLELFDLDNNGKISEEERQAVREVWEEHLREDADVADTQPTTPVDEE